MKEEIEKIITASNNNYALINNFISNNGVVEIIDYVYPEHDGVSIPEREAELIELRQVCYSLARACDLAIERCSEIIDINKENN